MKPYISLDMTTIAREYPLYERESFAIKRKATGHRKAREALRKMEEQFQILLDLRKRHFEFSLEPDQLLEEKIHKAKESFRLKWWRVRLKYGDTTFKPMASIAPKLSLKIGDIQTLNLTDDEILFINQIVADYQKKIRKYSLASWPEYTNGKYTDAHIFWYDNSFQIATSFMKLQNGGGLVGLSAKRATWLLRRVTEAKKVIELGEAQNEYLPGEIIEYNFDWRAEKRDGKQNLKFVRQEGDPYGINRPMTRLVVMYDCQMFRNERPMLLDLCLGLLHKIAPDIDHGTSDTLWQAFFQREEKAKLEEKIQKEKDRLALKAEQEARMVKPSPDLLSYDI